MSNYYYSNQNKEAESISNPEKLYYLLNKNIEAKNLFKGDVNLKSKERIYYINSKKDNHLISKGKENETNGPKMLTMNFPPGFMISGNNNSRKNASHEKNLYMEKNMANNMELNDLGSDNEKIFANTAKKEFQDYNDYKDNKINIFGLKQKLKSFNQNYLEKENIYYKGSFIPGTEKENNYEMILNNIKTEGSDYKNNSKGGTAPTNFKSILNYNNNPFNMSNNQGNKTTTNLLYNSNVDYIDNNNYNSNSYNYKNYYKKNINGNSSGSNKQLVFNPSSITNQRMVKKNSDSELIPSSVENYIKNINYYSNQNQSDNHSKFSSSNDSKTKTQTKYIKNIKPNYYESIINELQSNTRNNGDSEIEYNKDILKYIEKKRNKMDKVNIGITYKIYNGYKYFFDIQNGQIYILKEVPFNIGKGIIHSLEEWSKKYENDELYLKIYGHENNHNVKQTIWMIQYPRGGESLYDVINSVGFYDQNILFNIVTKIYKSIIKLKEYDKYLNVPFCLCDIYIDVNEHIKIIPPLIRNINLNINKKNTFCKCKKYILLFQKIFNINKGFISFFCLGFLIIQIITQNLIFELNSFKYILKKVKNNTNNNSSLKKCCFIHLLLDNESQRLNGKDYLLFSQFLNLYPKSLLDFLHKCTSFENEIPSSASEFLNLYDTDKNLNLSFKEILGITNLTENKYIQLEDFLNNFEFKCEKMNLNINKEEYIRKLNSYKIFHILSRVFGIDKEYFYNKFNKKIEKINYCIKNKEKNKMKEKGFYEDINNNNNYSELFIGYTSKRDDEKKY